MTTAQRIIASHSQETFAERAKLESEALDLSVAIGAPNCYDRVFVFYDGSEILKTAEGYKAQ